MNRMISELEFATVCEYPPFENDALPMRLASGASVVRQVAIVTETLSTSCAW
jgi:hypothetical protein